MLLAREMILDTPEMILDLGERSSLKNYFVKMSTFCVRKQTVSHYLCILDGYVIFSTGWEYLCYVRT